MYDVFFIPPLLLKLRCITYLIQQDWFVVCTYSACLESSSKIYQKQKNKKQNKKNKKQHIFVSAGNETTINSADLILLHK